MGTTDYAELRDHAGYRDDLVIRLGAEYGLRSFEIPQVRSKDIRPYHHDGEETAGTLLVLYELTNGPKWQSPIVVNHVIPHGVMHTAEGGTKRRLSARV